MSLEDLLGYLRRYRVLIGALAVALILAVVGGLAGREERKPEPPPAVAIPTTSPAETSTTAAAIQPESDVLPLDCSALITSEETAEALVVGSSRRPA